MSNPDSTRFASSNPARIAPMMHAAAAALAALALAWAVPGMAQDQEEQEKEGVTAALMEEVIVTARKREEFQQQVPVAISAYSGAQLEALKVRTLENLTVGMPNVAMDDIGTTRGVANFSIRGLGINSSIPGIDPTVGVFIDGVYLAQNAGTIIDMFDLESIEVLRGPQGTLFGRNVTGGAVLINTRRPTEEVETAARAAVEGNPDGDGGLNYYFMGSLSGPLGDTFKARISVYFNEDDGWHENLFNGRDHGAASTSIVRPVFSWQPTDTFELQFRWEHTESDNDGPASQTHTNGLGIPGFFTNFERDSFDFAIDETGFLDFEVDMVTVQADWDIAFGDGTITNIFGWRDYFHESYGDIDAQPVWLFHAGSFNDQEQWSDELRYNGNFGNSNVTVGLYWLDNEISYSEGRDFLGIALAPTPFAGNPFVTQDGGGILEVESKAIFASVDHALNDRWSLNVGLRYTSEDKDARITTLPRHTSIFGVSDNSCLVFDGSCVPDFVDSDSWDALSGKLGFTYAISDDQRMYAHWSRGHRSGGYNLRNTSVVFNPGPFDEETVDTLEVGYKSELGGRGRLNAAAFYTSIDDMQRELNLADPVSGVVQITRNTAEATIYGFEIDGVFAVGDSTAILASLGWVDPEYDKVLFDLNGDGVIDDKDKALKLPRAAEWTYSIGLTHDWFLANGGAISLRANYAYRDDSFYTDNNLGFLLSQEILDAGIDYTTPNANWVFSLYGRNMLDDVNHGGDTQLPAFLPGPTPTGGTFSPLNRGQVIGFEVNMRY